MPEQYRKPGERNFESINSIGKMIAAEQLNSEGGDKTTDAITGSQQYVVTAYTASDILQGTLNFRDPSESLLVTNLALTNHLKTLYAAGADGFSSFSTAAPASLTSGSSSDWAGSDALDPTTGLIRQEWVETLPSAHTNGAFLWSTRGKGSREMHLPVSAKIQDDVRMHKQYPDMKPEWRHPWNMDRVNGTVGGEAKIYYDVNDAQTVIGESATANGQPGAFGLLTPEEEQFYISMAWPYKGDAAGRFNEANRPDVAEKAKTLDKSLYKGLRVLVYCVQTQKAVVCTPGDWGPHPYYSNGTVKRSAINGSYFGLSPDTHWALGSEGGMDFITGIVPDGTPLGPFTPQNSQQGSVGNGVSGFTNASGSFINTPEEMKYAGERITSHPNFLMPNANGVFRNGFTMDPRSANITPAKNAAQPGHGFLMPSLLNWLWYCMEGGFIFAGYLGSYGFKMATFNKSRVSNHAKGGAIDIGRLGHVTYGNGVTYSLADLSKSRVVMELLIDFMATLPKTTHPDEVGGPYENPKNSRFHVYLDPGHIHFGFSEMQCGSLIPALKKSNSNPLTRGLTRS